MRRRTQPVECPVCFELFEPIHVNDDNTLSAIVYDNALTCANGHNTCVTCIARLSTPCEHWDNQCSGLRYACPLCRHSVRLTQLHMLVVLKGSWASALECFASFDSCVAWMQRERAYDSVDTATTEEDSGVEEDEM